MDTNTILLSALTALIGAFIGTFGGAFLINWKNESKIKKVRKVAIKGLEVIKKYAKNNGTYNNTKDDFNITLNIAEKRAILVCLHKLGVPIEIPVGNKFEIKNIQFSSKYIDKNEIEDMKTQIDKGHCDNLFFMDVDRYFIENTRIKTIRDIGRKFVKECMSETKYNPENMTCTFPPNWIDKFSYGELQRVLVFKSEVMYSGYFNNDGKPNTAKINQLMQEIDDGLWDEYLQWDYNAYRNLLAQKQSAEAVGNMLRMNLLYNQQIETKNLEKIEKL